MDDAIHRRFAIHFCVRNNKINEPHSININTLIVLAKPFRLIFSLQLFVCISTFVVNRGSPEYNYLIIKTLLINFKLKQYGFSTNIP